MGEDNVEIATILINDGAGLISLFLFIAVFFLSWVDFKKVLMLHSLSELRTTWTAAS